MMLITELMGRSGGARAWQGGRVSSVCTGRCAGRGGVEGGQARADVQRVRETGWQSRRVSGSQGAPSTQSSVDQALTTFVGLTDLRMHPSVEGGDLRSALSGASTGHQLQWWRRGKEVALDIVRCAHQPGWQCAGWQVAA